MPPVSASYFPCSRNRRNLQIAMRKHAIILGFFAAACLSAQSIQYVEARKLWLLTTQQSSYAIGIDQNGAVQNLYWGEPLWRIDGLPSATPHREYSSFDPGEIMDTEEYPDGWPPLL